MVVAGRKDVTLSLKNAVQVEVQNMVGDVQT